MTRSVCKPCRSALKTRLQLKLTILSLQRRGLHCSSTLFSLASLPTHIQSLYWEINPPTPQNLTAATSFFKTHPPRKLWTATEWRKQNNPTPSPSTPTTSTQPQPVLLTPEVVFLGRSNVGKSSLLNALLQTPNLNRVGASPGKTKTMHAWSLSPTDPLTGGAQRGFKGDTSPKLTLLDMPGYGHGSHTSWGQEIMTYLRRRKQLRRAFLLIHAEHGVKESDQKMLNLLRTEGIPHELVASKCDTVRGADALQHSLAAIRSVLTHDMHGRPTSSALALGEIVAVGHVGDGRKNDHVKTGRMRGVMELQWAVLRAAGLEGYAMDLSNGGSKRNPMTPMTAKVHDGNAGDLTNLVSRYGPQVGGMAELISTSSLLSRRRKLNAA